MDSSFERNKCTDEQVAMQQQITRNVKKMTRMTKREGFVSYNSGTSNLILLKKIIKQLCRGSTIYYTEKVGSGVTIEPSRGKQ